MKKFAFFIFFALINLFAFSQVNEDTLMIAEDLIYNQDFSGAIRFYRRLIQMDPTNPDFYYKLGFCYLNTEGKQDSSTMYLRKSLNLIQSEQNKHKKWWKKVNSLTVSPQEVKFYLARAYRVNFQFDSALMILNQLKTETKNKKFLELIDKEIGKAQTGKELTAHPLNIKVENLGQGINTEFTEHTPVFTADESELFFTSRRPLWPNSQEMYDGEYDENIYVVKRNADGTWGEPEPVPNINTPDHEATISLSYDGTKLFIYKSEDNGSIYYSEFRDGEWQPPVKLGKNINTKYRETHASLSVDGKTLYFTSDRPGGYGGLDIYRSRLQPDGTWGPAENLGPAINTPEDEEGPYIHPDNKTLYFSSKGHNTMGGYDIFKDTINQFGTWGKPVNLGYPINSEDDDVFYFPTADGKRAYFASKKGEGFGRSDIYMMYIPEARGTDVVVYRAKLAVCEGELPPADILVTDYTIGQSYPVTPKNDKFIFIGTRGHKIGIEVSVNMETVYKDEFTVPKDAPNILMYKTIRLDPDVPCEKFAAANENEGFVDPKLIGPNGDIYDKYVEIENILFPFNGVGTIKPNATLDTLVKYLKENPSAVIEIIGYADASGRAEYNYKLGLKRAQAVKDYLVKRGVNPDQLVAVSYGEENPIAKNRNPDGSWNPEGQRYNRRVEFKVLKQGETTLLIWGMKVPDKLKNPNYKYNYKKDPNKHLECEI